MFAGFLGRFGGVLLVGAVRRLARTVLLGFWVSCEGYALRGRFYVRLVAGFCSEKPLVFGVFEGLGRECCCFWFGEVGVQVLGLSVFFWC